MRDKWDKQISKERDKYGKTEKLKTEIDRKKDEGKKNEGKKEI